MGTNKFNPFDLLKRKTDKEADPLIVLRNFSQILGATMNPNSLAETSVQAILDAVGARHGYLFQATVEVEHPDDFCHLHCLGGIFEKEPEEIVIKNNSPALHILKDLCKPLASHALQSKPEQKSLFDAELAYLQAHGMEIWIPIHIKDEWAGLLALGPKASGGAYLQEDLALLETMAGLISLAFQNLQMGESLLRVNNEFRRAYQSMEQSNRHLKHTLTKLERIDKTKSDFIHIASHELRTPLTVMLGYNEMLMDDPELSVNDYHSQLIKGIHKGITRMNEVIESMLDMASIDARSLSLHKEKISIANLIQIVVGGLIPALEDRKIDLTAEKLSDLPSVEGDRKALEKVFRHLLINAIKYTPDGGSITVTGLPVSLDQENLPTESGVEIIISDTGIGIDQKQLDLIFTKFYQTGDLQHHSTGKTKFKGGGPGLGLAIAKGIVEAHGGKIWAASSGYDEQKCPGSQFHVILPLKNPTWG